MKKYLLSILAIMMVLSGLSSAASADEMFSMFENEEEVETEIIEEETEEETPADDTTIPEETETTEEEIVDIEMTPDVIEDEETSENSLPGAAIEEVPESDVTEEVNPELVGAGASKKLGVKMDNATLTLKKGEHKKIFGHYTPGDDPTLDYNLTITSSNPNILIAQYNGGYDYGGDENMPKVSELYTAYTKANAAYIEAKKVVDEGSLGFFKWHEGDNSMAVQIMNELTESQKNMADDDIHKTKLGADGDATNLETMKLAVEYIKEGNQLRVNDDLFPGCTAHGVTDAIMAVAQGAANYERGDFDHWVEWLNTNRVSENMAGNGIDYDPYNSWYYEEKNDYIEQNGGQTGHYFNLLSPHTTITGFGIALYSGTFHIFTQDFGKSTSRTYDNQTIYSDTQYANDFMTYYNQVMGPYNAAKAERNKKLEAYLNSIRIPFDLAANGAGTATITVTGANGVSSTCEVTIIAPAESVSLDKTSLTVEAGSSASLKATVNPADATNKSVTWSSSATNVATVDNQGRVTGKTPGTAVIKVKTNDGGFEASCTVTVKQKPATPTPTPSSNPDNPTPDQPDGPTPVNPTPTPDTPTPTPVTPTPTPDTPTPDTPTPDTKTVEMYRMYNPNSGEHFYTGNAAEKESLINSGWKYEGIGFKAPAKSNSPMYRLYNPNAGDHHYTGSAQEKASLLNAGWKDEGIGWYADDAHGVAMFRLYNPNATGAGSHHYTASEEEKNNLINIGWKYEGIGFYTCKR